MEKKIKELIEKYNCKITEEPLHYFQWLEIIKDLNTLKNERKGGCCIGRVASG